MNRVVALARFIWDFVIGDDPRIALCVLIALLVTLALSHDGGLGLVAAAARGRGGTAPVRGARRRRPAAFALALGGGDQSVLVGEHDDLDPVAQIELGQDTPDMTLHGGLGEDQLLGDLGVREAA